LDFFSVGANRDRIAASICSFTTVKELKYPPTGWFLNPKANVRIERANVNDSVGCVGVREGVKNKSARGVRYHAIDLFRHRPISALRQKLCIPVAHVEAASEGAGHCRVHVSQHHKVRFFFHARLLKGHHDLIRESSFGAASRASQASKAESRTGSVFLKAAKLPIAVRLSRGFSLFGLELQTENRRREAAGSARSRFASRWP
jgi:hypothetical protein